MKKNINEFEFCPSCHADLELGRRARPLLEEIAKQKIGSDENFPQEDYENADWEDGFATVVEKVRELMKGEKG